MIQISSSFNVKYKRFLISHNILKCVSSNCRFCLNTQKQRNPLFHPQNDPINFHKSFLYHSRPYSTQNSTFDLSLTYNPIHSPALKFSNRDNHKDDSIDPGDLYLENMFNFSPNEWLSFIRNSENNSHFITLLTHFQRYIRHIKCSELLYIIEKCVKFGVRDNNEGIDVCYVLLCEILYRFLHENNRILRIKDISRLTKVLLKIKFNKESPETSTVPICSMNFEYNKEVSVCDNCKLRYGDLLNLNGSDLSNILMVVLGKSLLLQSKDMRKSHENSVVPYLVLVGNRNSALCSHLVMRISSVYSSAFLLSNSIHNISILLHTIKRTKTRAFPLLKMIVNRLSTKGEIESLLDKESNLHVKLISISQIIQFCINCHYSYSQFNLKIDSLIYSILKYVYGIFSGENMEEITKFPNFVSQLNLLKKSINLERVHLKRLIEGSEISCFLDSLEHIKPTFAPNEFKTSNIHSQVDTILKSFNYETLLEHYVCPYIVDIFVPSKNVIIEVDGPYHYSTTINPRINKILKREVDNYRLGYTLNSKLKSRILTKSGFKFINIPFYQWPQTTNEQVYFISNLKI
uniref:RAP domain containing protein, putative n=1 Tax=Theileria annulata TaxID=5874 RepID=A0A3B0MS31_THEAN